MNILVAGGAGFLGTNLILKLLENEENKIILLDNFSTGRLKNVDLFKDKLLNFFCIDISEVDNWVDIFVHNVKIDIIYNFACPASPSLYQKDPIFTLDTCYLGTKNLLNLALKKQSIYIHASTSEIYGDPTIDIQHESYKGNVNTFGPRACYDEGKRVAETLCYEYIKKGVDVKIARIFNTYGPYMDKNDGRVVSNFINQALNNQDITVYGDGSQTRSICYVDDLIEAFIRLSKTNKQFNGPVNLGNNIELSVKEIAEMVLTFIPQSTSKIIHHPLPEDDPKQRKPDISLAQKILQWSPKVSPQDGIQKTIEYFRNINE
jgi:UDP-glucuronate decarboxylase